MTQTAAVTWTPDIMSAGVTLVAAGATHEGAVRRHNEDAWLVSPPVYVVADGMGGHAAGDVASRLVIEAFAELAGRDDVTAPDIERVLESSRAAVSALATSPVTAPGSTVIAAVYVVERGRGYWLLVNIGDSRAYLLTPERLEQVSHDHSLVQEMIDAGEIDEREARVHPDRHVITRAIGAVDDAAADFTLMPARGGTRLLLCSDGLTGELDDERIERVLRGGASAGVTAARLVAAAVEAGGHDNVTAIVIDVIGSDVVSHADTLGSGRSDPEVDTVPQARSHA
ncbi:PP2C family serine/threonine-protein phosphatase [Aeromicrobium sp. Leaf350]|uniref:PP2C family protein-serine/threonine phosphatase n=1 Tax=Aeromicrobium sp. Leaf350 TaxID=2876565 RepID=UPI001E5DA0C8|nr:protein phosphatase 2C domain-containing protein [Aeromicrobium sp. Leaf350]